MCLDSLAFKLAALLLWIIFLLASLSIIEATDGNAFSAFFLVVSSFKLLMALRVVLC
nr:hypothetical protein [uncultured bacterium]